MKRSPTQAGIVPSQPSRKLTSTPLCIFSISAIQGSCFVSFCRQMMFLSVKSNLPGPDVDDSGNLVGEDFNDVGCQWAETMTLF